MANISDMTSDEIKARYSELRQMEENGTLDDAGRSELQQMRDLME